MSAPSPSWYDLLGVAPDADETEVRAAWRAAIADLDPTDRRFGVLNRAAEVLLDPTSRAAYDAELRATEPEPEPESGLEPDPDPAAPYADADPDPDAGHARSGRRVVPAWLLAAVAAVTVLVAGAAVFVATTIPSDAAVEDASAAARSAAERAAVPVLSYDATRLDASRASAEQYLTGDYRKKYDDLFNGVIAKNAPETGTVVRASVVRSGLTRVDGDRAQVFLLVDQSRTNKASAKPVVYRNWVTVTMSKVDGDWLISGMQT